MERAFTGVNASLSRSSALTAVNALAIRLTGYNRIVLNPWYPSFG
jgi:hypothetical protein